MPHRPRIVPSAVSVPASLLDLVSEAIFELDSNGNILYLNAKAASLLGAAGQQACGRSLAGLLQPGLDHTPVKHWIDRAIKEKASISEKLTLPSTGSWVSMQITPAQNGAMVMITRINEDATEPLSNGTPHKKAGEEQSWWKDLFREFITASSDMVYKMSADWTQMYHLAGKNYLPDTEAADNAWLHKYIPPHEQPRVLSAIDHSIRNKTTFDLEHEVIGADGSIGWVTSRAVPVLNEQHELVEWIGIGNDITARKKAEQALKESEELLRATTDSSMDMIQVFEAIRNESGEIIDFKWILNNHASEKIYGDIIGKSLLELNPGVIEEGIFDTFKRVAETGVPDQTERHYAHEQFNGWFFQSTVKLNDGVATTTTDITARKNAEQEIFRLKDEIAQKSTDKYQALFNSINDGSTIIELILDKTGRLDDIYHIEANEAYKRLTGLDVAGKRLREFMPEVEQKWLDFYEEVALTGMAERIDYVESLKRWYRCSASRIGEEGSLQVAVIFNDVTESKIEQQSRFFLASIVESSTDSIVTIDFNHIITSWNKGAEILYGYSAADVIGKSLTMLTLPEDFRQLLSNIDRIKHSKVVERFQTVRKDKQKHLIDLEIELSPVKNDKDEVIGVSTIARDITQRKLAEEKIKESEAKYKSLIGAAPIGIALFIGRDLILESANQKYIDLIGKGNDIEGKKFTAVMPELVGQPYLKILDDIFITGKSYQSFADPVSVVRNGKHRHEFYDIDYVPLFDSEGKVYAILNIATDVTIQTQLNIKIEESEKYVRRLFMQAPAIIVVHRGPQHVYELSNEMHQQLIGNRELLGKPVREAMPELEGTGIYELLDHVYSTGEPYIGNEVPVKVDTGTGKLEDFYFNFVYQPVHNSEGEINGIFVHGVDVTEQVLSRRKIEENEERQAYLLKLSDTLHLLADPLEIQDAAARLLGEYLNADRAFYAQVTLKDGAECYSIKRLYQTEGNDFPLGDYPLYNFGRIAELNKQGAISVCTDVETESLISKEELPVYRALNIRAFAAVPLIRDRKLIALLAVHHRIPREWTKQEIDIIRETAERAWSSVLHANVEKALLEAEQEHRIQLEQQVKERTSQLEESKHFIQRVLEASPDHIMVFDLGMNKIEFVNRHPYKEDQARYEETLNIDYERLLNRCHPADRENLHQYIQSFRTANDELRTFDYRVVKDDAILWYRSRGRVFKRDKAGLPTHYLSIVHDITESKIAERVITDAYAQLQKQQSMLQEAETIGLMGSWEKNMSTGELQWSDGLYRIYGMGPQSRIMTSEFYISYLVHPRDKVKVRAHLKSIYGKLNDKAAEYRIITPQGEKVVFSQPRITFDENGQAKMFRGIVRDITQQKKAENELVSLKLDQQKELLNAVLMAQEAERERIGEALHNGVGQLLYGVKIRSEMLKSNIPGAQAQLKEIDALLEEAIRETRSISFQLVPIVLKDFGLETALRALFERIVKPGLHITVDTRELKHRLPEDQEIGIYRITQELVNNILKHSKASTAQITVKKDAKNITLLVHDNGTGFDEQQLSRMHKGIGLQSIKNRARLLNAKLSINSAAGKGTTVLVEIPVR